MKRSLLRSWRLYRSVDSEDAVLDAVRQSTALGNEETRGQPAVALVSGFKSWRGAEVLVIPAGRGSAYSRLYDLVVQLEQSRVVGIDIRTIVGNHLAPHVDLSPPVGAQ